MNFQTLTYLGGDTPVHCCDARVKVLLLFFYSVAIFFANSWLTMVPFAIAVVIAAAVARIPAKRMAVPLVPVMVLALFAVAFAFASTPTRAGLSSGLIVGVRMVALVAASLVVCFTTTSTALLRAFTWIIGPLGVLRVPVDDIAVTLALALRFIPVIVEELSTVRAAQRIRGGDLQGLSFKRKLQIWGTAFSAVFVGLFRHADSLAVAMDARCYGASERRTSLH